MGAQVGFGGYSKALEALFRAAASQPALTWPMLDGVSISRAGPGDVSVSELLLSSSLPEKTRLAFYSKALSRMPSGLLREIGALGHEEPVPVLDPVLAASKAQDGSYFGNYGSVRWFVPPVAVRPQFFRLGKRVDARRLSYLQTENRWSTTTGYAFDPVASREVFPLVMDWLKDQTFSR